MAAVKHKKFSRKPEIERKTVLESMTNQNPEQSRMNIRLATSVKERVARAASLTGQDLTEFAVSTLSEKADLVIERHDHLLFGSKEHEFFLNALAETTVPEPSERSRSAAERYRRGKRKGARYAFAD